MLTQILESEQDQSINFVNPTEDGGAIESRYVRRTDDTVIIYLSSASGCKLACRFCHLTQTGQTMNSYTNPDGYLQQARDIFNYLAEYDKIKNASLVHFNFMARGDAVENPHFVHQTKNVILGLRDLALSFNLKPLFKISTIFPKSDMFGSDYSQLKDWIHTTLNLDDGVEFYYSLYSLDYHFRKRWIPKAIDPEIVGDAFAGTTEKIRLHHALIEGENLSTHDVTLIGEWLQRHRIKAKFNLVRYNPHSTSCGQEPPFALLEIYEKMIADLPNITKTQIISRVGCDVFASCGQFIER